ncbi:hypothetical protein [Pseudofrankia asymbiotica]|uniref:Uncharacterized protein n=1 Tax=Pseudofrankia asymbiotica TaxID=1834516 RepID=A0A1V2HYY8_9ACTN|nr:hypothetical protein [Pseudofrankia asymbiotica]ONH21833.1 hypothetical protein BL253_37710 [Pseudofrankia asymbiotica]
MDMMIDVDGGAGGLVTVALDAYPLPAKDGVLLGQRSAECGGETGLAFVPSYPYPPDGVAWSLAANGKAWALVVCPRLVSPARSMLALVVARLLADQRAALTDRFSPVITCGTRPRFSQDSGYVAIPHLVSVVATDAVQLRVVWEVSDRSKVPGWLESLRPSGSASTEAVAVAA